MKENNIKNSEEEQLLEQTFPNGYEEIDIPLDKISESCSCGTKTLKILSSYKENNSKRVAIISICLKCKSIYINISK